jgi:SOS-response transcriptional repressor LexA
MSAPRFSNEQVLAELLALCRNLGRTPTFRELGEMLGLPSSASVQGAVLRLRELGILREELWHSNQQQRIALSPRASEALARVILGLREPADAASELVARAGRRAA